MQETFIKVLLSVFSLALLAVPGFIVGKLRLLPENAGKTLTSVLLYIGQPLLSFMSFQKCEYYDSVVGDRSRGDAGACVRAVFQKGEKG